MNLTDFLLARIEEDEANAKTAAMGLGALSAFGIEVMGRKVYTPARARAECEAKRQIVKRFAGLLDEHFAVHPSERNMPSQQALTHSREQRMHELKWVLALLALPYADHPDYREEWKP